MDIVPFFMSVFSPEQPHDMKWHHSMGQMWEHGLGIPLIGQVTLQRYLVSGAGRNKVGSLLAVLRRRGCRSQVTQEHGFLCFGSSPPGRQADKVTVANRDSVPITGSVLTFLVAHVRK